MITISLIKFSQHVDAQGNEIRNRKVEKVASLPSPIVGDTGREVFLTTTNRFYVCTGSAWELKATDSDKLEGNNAAFHLARGNHTGTQTSTTISDFDTQVRTSRLDQMAIPTADLNLNSKKVTNLLAGTAGTDAVNKTQLDAVAAIANGAASGVSLKPPVRGVTATNITLSGTQTIDTSVVLVAGDRVLVAGQTLAKDNGIYVVAAGAWSRATDADGAGELAAGTLVAVTEGTANADTLWGLITDAAITIGTTNQNWAKVIGGGVSGFTVAGNGLTSSGSTVSVQQGLGIIADGSSTRIDTTLVVRKYVGPVTAGASPRPVTHTLGTQDVTVSVIEVGTGDIVLCGIKTTGVNTLELDFSTAVTSNQYRVIVTG